MEFTETLEDLIGKNAAEYEFSKLFKKAIQEYLQSLEELFWQNQGKDFLVRHTKRIDGFITQIYGVALRLLFDNYMPMKNSIPVALIALGSYGREQLCVYSDIDLMIVYRDIPGYNTHHIIEKFLYITFDAGLKLGHRVHRIDELRSVAQEDITIKTALIESRFVCGSSFIWSEVENELTKIRHTNQKSFILGKLAEASKRKTKYPLTMEPNIKECPGGLRDANMVFWIANILYGIKSIKELTNRLFGEEEYREFRMALEFLFRLRSALHLAAHKKQDTLALQYIPDVARRLGYRHDNPQKLQTALAKKTLQSLWTIQAFSDFLVQKMARPFLFDAGNIAKLRSGRIAPGIYLYSGTIFASSKTRPPHINDLLSLMLALEDRHLVFDASFVHLASRCMRAKVLPAKSRTLFKKLFYKEHLAPILELFYQAGLLAILVSPLRKVAHLAQFDGYHQYPVDVHSLKTLFAMENIREPFVQELYGRLGKEEKAMLKLTALLHDAGKGRIQDHSEVGAKLLRGYAKKIGFDDSYIETGARLVRYHVLMSNVAHNEDIYSQKIIFEFTSHLGDQKTLDMLYILTYADITAVGKEVYTSFDSRLLRELYSLSLGAFEKKEILDETAKRIKIENALKKEEAFGKLPAILQRKIHAIESNLFFIKNKPADIMDICKRAEGVQDFLYTLGNEEFLSIKIIRKTPLNLGYLLGKLSFLDVAAMDIFKLYDDKKYFNIEFRESLNREDLPLIEKIIADSFDMKRSLKLTKPEIKKNEIMIDCEHSKTYAKMTLETKNQKGLLAYIVKIFDEMGIDIATAKIHTIKNMAKDLFLIEKNGKFCHNKDKILEALTK